MGEKRVLALPSTEDVTNSHHASSNHRQKLADDYLQKALGVIEATMDGMDKALAYKAAQWVAEMVMGKPKQSIEQEGGTEAEMARLLGLAYAEHLKSQAALPPSVQDGVYVLGETVDAEYHEVTENVNNVAKAPNTKHVWDELPE